MELIEAANYFSTLVMLLSLWKTERGAETADQYADFLVYLDAHHFAEIREKIEGSQELQVQLRKLLSRNHREITQKLDVIAQSISALGEKFEVLAPIVKAIGASGERLSEQASQMLMVFDQSGATSILRVFNGDTFRFSPGNTQVQFTEGRFVTSDLESLIRFGFIQFTGPLDRFGDCFVITRLGARFAANLIDAKSPADDGGHRSIPPAHSLVTFSSGGG